MKTSNLYIGDLSESDADVLRRFGRNAHVLEFGAGGSTQILARVAARIVTIEDDPLWIVRTERNFQLLNIEKPVVFKRFADLGTVLSTQPPFTLVFCDGPRDRRQEFILRSFSKLPHNGWLLVHDTRRDMRHIGLLIAGFGLEADLVHLNMRPARGLPRSNITAIRKTSLLSYENWNKVEQKESWMFGVAEAPENAKHLLEKFATKPGTS